MLLLAGVNPFFLVVFRQDHACCAWMRLLRVFVEPAISTVLDVSLGQLYGKLIDAFCLCHCSSRPLLEAEFACLAVYVQAASERDAALPDLKPRLQQPLKVCCLWQTKQNTDSDVVKP